MDPESITMAHTLRGSERFSFDQLMRKAFPNGHSATDERSAMRALAACERGIVIKAGGSAISGRCRSNLNDDIGTLSGLGVPIVIVHGGGDEITSMMKLNRIDTVKVNGERVTTAEALEIVELSMGGIGFDIKMSLTLRGVSARRIMGNEGTLAVRQKSPELQFVGEVVNVDVAEISRATGNGSVAVVTPLGTDGAHTFNINADRAASSIAIALGSASILFMTDVEGIDTGNGNAGIMAAREARALVGAGIVKDGMIPKVLAASAAAESGVRASIISSAHENPIISHLFGSENRGTEITA